MALKKWIYGKFQHQQVYYPEGLAPALTSASDPKHTKSHLGYHVPKVFVASGQTNGMSTPEKSTKNIGGSAMDETLELFPRKRSRTTIYSALVSLSNV